jgi:acetoacetyl-CoA reductase/3-oxoacyl-[acyl-carrier protein] reductase
MKILITGAAKGIGCFLMDRLLEDGIRAYGTYHHTLPKQSHHSSCKKVDITKQTEIDKWVEWLPLNDDKDIVLINCAGINYNSTVINADIDKWEGVIATNLIGTFRVIKAILPYMREKRYGRIINFSSVVAQKGIPGTSAYAASKAALWGMTKSIVAEYGHSGITINTVNLGYFDIGMIAEVPTKMQAIIKENIPSKQFGDPENIYQTIKLLIKADYINGSAIDVNGGMY